MNSSPFLVDIETWARQGPGMELQFFATDMEVKGWLISSLPPEYAPYQLVGSDLVKQARRHFAEQPFSFDLSAFPECMQGIDDGRVNFWIHSKVLTPDLVLRPGTRIDGICSCNGLLLLQHGISIEMTHTPRGQVYRDSSRIALVDWIKNLQTGESRFNKSYIPVYDALSKVIKDAAVYSTVHTFADGQTREDTELHLMTEGAVQACREGMFFTDAPGRRLK